MDEILTKVVGEINHINKKDTLLHIIEVFNKIKGKLNDKKITFYVINLKITDYKEYKKMMKIYETVFNIYNFDGSKSNFDI